MRQKKEEEASHKEKLKYTVLHIQYISCATSAVQLKKGLEVLARCL
jgi:hypothetical protein